MSDRVNVIVSYMGEDWDSWSLKGTLTMDELQSLNPVIPSGPITRQEHAEEIPVLRQIYKYEKDGDEWWEYMEDTGSGDFVPIETKDVANYNAHHVVWYGAE